MAGELQLDPDELRRHAAQLADLGDRVGRTYAGLREALAYADGSWGDDRLGAAFAEGFVPNADQLLAGQRAMEQGLHDTAAAIRNAGHGFSYADQLVGNRVTRAADNRPGMVSGESTGTSPDPVPSGPVTQHPASLSAPPRPTMAPGSASPDPARGPGAGIPHPTMGPGTGTPSPAGGPTTGTPNPPGAPTASSSEPRSSNPAVETPNQRGRPAPAQSPDRRTPGLVPAPTGRDVARNPAITAGPSRPSDAAPARTSVSTARGITPWSAPPSGTPSAQPVPGSNPQSSAPQVPRSQPQQPGDPRRDAPQRPDETPRRSPLLAWLARTLAQRHGVEVVGFDLPDLDEVPVREFAAAVDRVLTDYPMIVVDVVAVGDLGAGGGPVCWRRESRKSGTVRSIVLDERTAVVSSGPATERDSVAVSERSRLYADTVRAFGAALDDAGGGVARVRAQRVLIAEYMRGVAGRYTTLAELVRGYRQWRAGLVGAVSEIGRFEIGRALGAGFAEVVLRGGQACAPARALHTLLVDAAPPRG